MSTIRPRKAKDCRVIIGDAEAVVISRDSAIHALYAMQAQAKAGAYKSLFVDDASFVRAALKELETAQNGDGQCVVIEGQKST